MNIIIPPDKSFGVAYSTGWIGFTRTLDTVGDLISYGERTELDGLPSVNHALIVTGPDQCVQAHIEDGVQYGALSDYLNDPKTKVYFRKPLLWTPDLGQRIAASGISRIGDKYDKLLIAENAAADTLVGLEVNKLFDDWPHDFFAKLVARLTPDEFICSWLAAYALAAQPEFKGFGLFEQPLSAIDPELLFTHGPFAPEIADCSMG